MMIAKTAKLVGGLIFAFLFGIMILWGVTTLWMWSPTLVLAFLFYLALRRVR